MVPDHIDDLPRRDDDNRPLMLGLIDDFPQERKGTRPADELGVGFRRRSRSRAVYRSGLGHGAKLVIVDPEARRFPPRAPHPR